MRKGQKGVEWLVEHHGPESFVCDAEDAKGAIATMVCAAMAKKRRIFQYFGRNLPRNIIKDLGAKYPGLLIGSFKENPPNADMAYAESEDGYKRVWHNTIVLYFGKTEPPNSAVACSFPNEPPLHVVPAVALPRKSFQVSTRNCVDDKEIKNNVHYSLSLGLPCIPRFAIHGETGVVCSAGPSIVNHLADIQKHIGKDGERVLCVKHSHDLFLDAGIVPWACALLDPRAHVKDFIDRPHPGVKYFVSSTCHPSTFDRLLSRDAEIWLYHALVGAGEEDLIKMHIDTRNRERQRLREAGVQLDLAQPFEQADMMVSGGTTAASRGISLLHMMGFRRFTLFGFDSCFWEPKDLSLRNDDGNPKYHCLEIGGKQFFTDAELVAQVQDFKYLSGAIGDCTFDVRGDGMVPRTMQQSWRGAPQLDNVFPPVQ